MKEYGRSVQMGGWERSRGQGMIDDTGKGGGRVMMAAPVGSRALQKVRVVSHP